MARIVLAWPPSATARLVSGPVRSSSVTLRPVRSRPFPLVLGLVLVALVTVLAAGQLGLVGGSTAADPSASAGGATVRPAASAAAVAASPVAASPGGTPSSPAPASAGPTPRPPAVGPPADVPIVPVTNFRAAQTSTTQAELEDVLAGTSKRYTAVELVSDEADAILAALGVGRPSDASRLVLASDEPALAADLTKTGKRLAFLRADAVGPEVARSRGATRLSSVSGGSRPSPTGH